MRGQTVALAGLYQSLCLVQELARSGSVSDHPAFESCLMSVLRIDVDNALDAYGGADGIRSGLTTLQRQLSQRRDAQAWERARYAANLMLLERALRVRPDILRALGEGIAQVAAQLPRHDIDELPQVQTLAQLYSTHISPLGPRVMVNGDPSYLKREAGSCAHPCAVAERRSCHSAVAPMRRRTPADSRNAQALCRHRSRSHR